MMDNSRRCENCGHSFNLTVDILYFDDMGWHTVCPECGASFDTEPTGIPMDKHRRLEGAFKPEWEITTSVLAGMFSEKELATLTDGQIRELADDIRNGMTELNSGDIAELEALVDEKLTAWNWKGAEQV